MISKQLPKFCFSGRVMKPKGIVIHYFSCINVDRDHSFDLDACRNLMIDLNQPKNERCHYLKEPHHKITRGYASAHVLIGRNGETWKLIDFDKQAYHAGHSSLNGVIHCNRWTVGVELIGTIDSGFTDEQYCALNLLCAGLMKDYYFESESIAGHDQVRYEAILNGKRASYKTDPSGSKDGQGDNFDWDKLKHLDG